MRRLWIQRINAAARAEGITYNRFIQGLGLAGLEGGRLVNSQLSQHATVHLNALVATAREALPSDVNAAK